MGLKGPALYIATRVKRNRGIMLVFFLCLGFMSFINLGTELINYYKTFIIESLIFMFFGLMLNEGMVLINTFFEKKFSLDLLSFKRLFLEFLVVNLFSIALISIIYLLPMSIFVLDFTFNEVILIRIRQGYVFVFFLTSIIYVFRKGFWSYKFLLQASIAKEKMLKEQMKEQFELLKNQINRHFLFNSLNALTSLIYTNKDLASKFVDELSSVYRYILESRGKQLIEVKKELKFLESYSFLFKVRYRSGIEFEIIRENNIEGSLVPPQITHFIISNAIKYNILTKEMPLKIRIEIKDNYLYGRNNIQKKTSGSADSNHNFPSIIDEYNKISHQNIAYQILNGEFWIKVPLLKE